jgi:hypothetical protein
MNVSKLMLFCAGLLSTLPAFAEPVAEFRKCSASVSLSAPDKHIEVIPTSTTIEAGVTWVIDGKNYALSFEGMYLDGSLGRVIVRTGTFEDTTSGEGKIQNRVAKEHFRYFMNGATDQQDLDYTAVIEKISDAESSSTVTVAGRSPQSPVFTKENSVSKDWSSIVVTSTDSEFGPTDDAKSKGWTLVKDEQSCARRMIPLSEAQSEFYPAVWSMVTAFQSAVEKHGPSDGLANIDLTWNDFAKTPLSFTFSKTGGKKSGTASETPIERYYRSRIDYYRKNTTLCQFAALRGATTGLCP